MKVVTAVSTFSTAWLIAGAAIACDPVMDGRSLSEIRSTSKPVAVDPQCRTINAGVDDRLSLGPAQDLGGGRVMQVLGDLDQTHVLLADCNTREATILQGREVEARDAGCSMEYTFAPMVGEHAMMRLDIGANLQELVKMATAKGATELSPSQHFFMFTKWWESELHAVGRKDRFDLLCGCKLYYPDSAGACN